MLRHTALLVVASAVAHKSGSEGVGLSRMCGACAIRAGRLDQTAAVRIAPPHRDAKLGRLGEGAIVVVEVNHCHTLVWRQAQRVDLTDTVHPEGHDKAAIVPAQGVARQPERTEVSAGK